MMKKFINVLALAALLFLPWTVFAQSYESVPYSTGFEGLSTGSLPTGWIQIQTSAGYDGVNFPCAYNYSGNARNGSVYFEFETHSGQNEIVALPLMENISSLKLTFWASAQSNYLPVRFEVGVLEEDGTDTTFVPVDTIAFTTSYNWGSGYHEYTVYFADYTGSGERIAMRATGSGSGQYTLMMDDFSISEDNGCYPLSNLRQTAHDGESITIAWSDEMNNSVSYTVKYWKDGSTDTTEVTNISDTTYLATGLDAVSQYHFIVVPNCSTGDGIPISGTFSTDCAGGGCDITIQMADSYGDGWNGGRINFYQGGSLAGYAQLSSGSSGTTTVHVCSGTPVNFSWQSGSYDSEVSYTIYDGGMGVIYSSSTSGVNHSDNIANACPSCMAASGLAVDTADESSITLTWNASASASSYAIYLNGEFETSVSDTSYTFQGLNSNTAYSLGVQAICSGDDSANTVSITGRTDCGPMSIPFFDNFDSYANGYFPPCWHRLKVHGTDPSVNSQYHASGTQSMFLLDYQDTNIFATPTAIPLAGNEIQVSYKAYMAMGDASTWIKAGVMTDIADRSTFIMLDSIGYHDFNYAFEEHDFNTASLNASDSYYIVWMFYSSYSPYYSGRGGIDDISITQLTGCIRPTTASVGTVGARQVELSWNAVDGATGYTVYYGTVNDPTSSSLLSQPSTDTSFILTGLQPETHYYVWVATNCGGNESDLRYAGSFTTLISCPHVTNLTIDTTTSDGATVSWHAGDIETQWLVALDSDDYILVYDTTYTFYGLDPMTGHTVYVRAYCGDDDTSAVQNINFATSCEDATCNITLTMTDSYGDGWNGNAIQVLQAGIVVGQGTIASGNSNIDIVTVCSSAPVELRFVKGSYPDEMGGTVTDGSGATIFTIDNMASHNTGDLLATATTPCPSCIMPMNLTVDAITASDATIHWVAQEDQSSWYVILDSGDAISVTDTFYTFTGLNARTNYTAYVATDCADGLSNYASLSFTTDCATGSCDLSVTSTANYVYSVYCPTLHVWQNGVELATVNAATQTVNVCASIPVDILYEAPTYNWGDNPTAIILDANGDEIFNSGTDSYNTGDTLLSLANACATCIRPTGVIATAIDSNSVTFEWDIADSVYGYLVSFNGGTYYYTLTGYESFTGLLPNTEYTFSVLSLCTTTDTSNARTITVRTTCGAMTIPFVEDFESSTAGNAPTCWNIVSGNPEVDDYSNAHTGTQSLLMSGNDFITTSLVPLDGDSIHVSFWAKHLGGTLEAGVMTNPLFDTTFIPLVTSTGTSDNYTLFEFNTLTLDHYTSYYVAFRYNAPYNNIYIDDINIRVDDGCLHPSNLVATPTAANTTLTWHDGTGTANFVVEYRLTGGNWSTPVNVYDTTYSLTSLTASSSYEVRVGMLCGSDTLWTTTSFETPCSLLPLPYFENFDAYANDVMPPCWGWSSVSSTHWDGGVFLKSYHGGGSEYVVVPQLDGNIAKLKIEFDTKVGTPAENDGILIGVADASGTLLAWLDTIQDPNFSRNNHVHKTIYFTNYASNMPSGSARVAFAQYRNWNEWALIDNINIEELPECYPVDNLTGHNLDDPENTTFTWTPQGTANQWQVYVDTVTVDIDSLASMPISSFTTVYDTSYTIPIGLIQGGGIYNFFVRSNCGMEQSNWVKYEFGAGTVIMDQTSDTVTGCGFVVYDNGGPIAGYLANTNTTLVLRSENAGSQLSVFGGKFGFGMDPATLTIYDGEGTTGSVLYTYNTVNGRDTIDTVMCTSTTGSLTITFVVSGTMCHTGYELYIRCTGEASCPRPTELTGEMASDSVATISWNGTAPSYDFYYRISPDGTWLHQTVTTNSISLAGLVPDTLYDIYVIALCSATESSMPSVTRQLDTHYGDAPTPCPAPTDLSVSNITMNSVVIGWTATGSETSWRLEVNGSLVNNVNTNPCTLTGLTPATSYTIKVQALCDATESAWSDAVTFNTQEEDTAAVYYTVTLSCNSTMGNVTGSGTYAEGSEVTLIATSNPGYRFVEWSDGNTDSVRTIVVTADINLVAYFENSIIGIDDVHNSSLDVHLYPNPASSEVSVKVASNQRSVVCILDMNGRNVYTQSLNHPATQPLTIDVSELASGTYFLRVTSLEGTTVKKLIVR